MSRGCPVCKGTQGAHFHWCSKVGGPGHKPAPAPEPRAPTQAELDAEVIALLTGELAPKQPAEAPPVVPTEPAALAEHVDKIAEKARTIQQDLRDSLQMGRRKRARQERGIEVSDQQAVAALLDGRPDPAADAVVTRPPGPKEPRRPQRKRLQTDARPKPAPEPEYRHTEAVKIAKLRDDTAEVAEGGGWRWSDGREAPPDWDSITSWNLEALALEMADRCRSGLPAEVPYLIRDDVLAMEGFVEAEVDAALRHPERVTVRPETQDKDKRYPVLSFRRGDVNVILGTRNPAKPAVIAAYWTSLLMGYDPTYHRDRTGGGGSKEKASVPTTTQALLRRLKALGAYITPDPAGLTASVLYDGQDLGKINIGGNLPRTTVETDWQRTQRRIHAIDQRVAKVGGR